MPRSGAARSARKPRPTSTLAIMNIGAAADKFDYLLPLTGSWQRPQVLMPHYPPTASIAITESFVH